MATTQQQQQQQQVTCCVFGFGRAGRIHYGNLLQLKAVRVKYIVDAFPEAARDFVGDSSGSCVLTPDEEDRVFADDEVNFCVISSPTFTHEALIRKSVAAGKHMFCEKPVAKSVEAMLECYRLARERGVLLHCSFNRRYDPSFNLLKEKIPEVVGSVYSTRTCSRDSPPPPIEYLRTSGGIYHDCGIHDIDLTCWLMDDWPVSVFATGACHDAGIRELNDFDTSVIVMRFPGDRIATIDLCRHSTFGHDQRIEVHGSQGMLASNNLRSRAVTASTSAGVTDANIQYSFAERYAESYAESMRLFVSALRGDASSSSKLVTAAEAINACGIATAAESSARSRAPVAFTPATV